MKIHRQTEFADGKVADVKDAPVMAEALKNDVEILTSEEKKFLKELPVSNLIHFLHYRSGKQS